jgi:hypothetical protein
VNSKLKWGNVKNILCGGNLAALAAPHYNGLAALESKQLTGRKKMMPKKFGRGIKQSSIF